MKKTFLVLTTLLSLSLPLVSHADVSVSVVTPGISIQIGDRDNRGHYWDGRYWRDARWWSKHRHHYYYAPPPPVVVEWRGPPHARPHYYSPPSYRVSPPPPSRGHGHGHGHGNGHGSGSDHRGHR